MNNKLRWKIADLLNRIPRTCWADLVSWVQDPPSKRPRLIRDDEDYPAILSRDGASACRLDAALSGACYCGKFRTAEAQAEGGLIGSGFKVESTRLNP